MRQDRLPVDNFILKNRS